MKQKATHGKSEQYEVIGVRGVGGIIWHGRVDV